MVAQYVEALLDRGVLRHFLDKGEGLVRDDWDRASKAMPSVNVPEHVSQLLGEWVQLESWAKLPKARKLVALSEASKVCPRFVPIIFLHEPLDACGECFDFNHIARAAAPLWRGKCRL
jgi:hypothetical protein